MAPRKLLFVVTSILLLAHSVGCVRSKSKSRQKMPGLSSSPSAKTGEEVGPFRVHGCYRPTLLGRRDRRCRVTRMRVKRAPKGKGQLNTGTRGKGRLQVARKSTGGRRQPHVVPIIRRGHSQSRRGTSSSTIDLSSDEDQSAKKGKITKKRPRGDSQAAGTSTRRESYRTSPATIDLSSDEDQSAKKRKKISREGPPIVDLTSDTSTGESGAQGHTCRRPSTTTSEKERGSGEESAQGVRSRKRKICRRRRRRKRPKKSSTTSSDKHEVGSSRLQPSSPSQSQSELSASEISSSFSVSPTGRNLNGERRMRNILHLLRSQDSLRYMSRSLMRGYSEEELLDSQLAEVYRTIIDSGRDARNNRQMPLDLSALDDEGCVRAWIETLQHAVAVEKRFLNKRRDRYEQFRDRCKNESSD